jgi:DNA-directed RNA polymerase subunit RPC12/RpoP
MKTSVSHLNKPAWNQERVFKCANCEKVFMKVKILFNPKCPKCGSRNVTEDNRFRY